MQPYFFPYIGYFSLIKNTDKWIVFDTVQYIKKGWMNRNRIINPFKPESIYISVPIKKHEKSIMIKDVQIAKDDEYKDKIMGQIKSSYKKRAPFYSDVADLVFECLNYNTAYLSELNVKCLKETCSFLDIPFEYSIYSKMNLVIDEVNNAGEWALNISKALNANEYINPYGGIDIFEKQKFINNNIDLKFLKPIFREYDQKKPVFIEGLSIIDIMMFNDKQVINDMLNDFYYITS